MVTDPNIGRTPTPRELFEQHERERLERVAALQRAEVEAVKTSLNIGARLQAAMIALARRITNRRKR